eukprot:scaffold3319_cov427-Prasinococcus_capsulatus_cf.AAC.11
MVSALLEMSRAMMGTRPAGGACVSLGRLPELAPDDRPGDSALPSICEAVGPGAVTARGDPAPADLDKGVHRDLRPSEYRAGRSATEPRTALEDAPHGQDGGGAPGFHLGADSR